MTDLPKGYEAQERDAASLRRRLDHGKSSGGAWRAVRTDKPRWLGPWRNHRYEAVFDASRHARGGR